VSGPLSSREARGELDRDDFPLLRGKEVLMQAVYRGSAGQAFTSASGSFTASLGDSYTYRLILMLPVSQTLSAQLILMISLLGLIPHH